MITNYNRIISLRFFSANGTEMTDKAIKCPAFGRKPNIEISGLWTTETCVPTFNIKIRNLYMENIQDQYPTVEVEAGYYGQTVKFRGQITYMFTESPGPESSTVIMCQTGNFGDWLVGNVKIKQAKPGFQFSDAFSQIAKALGMTTVMSNGVKTITSVDAFQFTGKAKDALEILKKHFKEEIVIVPNGSQLQAYLVTESIGVVPLHIPFLTTPAQLIGGFENEVCATIASLWNPQIVPGSLVSFDNDYYSTKLAMTSKKSKLKMSVTKVNFSFSTTRGGNEMTLMGQVIK